MAEVGGSSGPGDDDDTPPRATSVEVRIPIRLVSRLVTQAVSRGPDGSGSEDLETRAEIDALLRNAVGRQIARRLGWDARDVDRWFPRG